MRTELLPVVTLLVGLVIGFFIGNLHPLPINTASTPSKTETSLLYEIEKTGIVANGFFSSLEEASTRLGIPSVLEKCKGDPRTLYRAWKINDYYRLVRCTFVPEGKLYCEVIESNYPTPNFVYWYQLCTGSTFQPQSSERPGA